MSSPQCIFFHEYSPLFFPAVSRFAIRSFHKVFVLQILSFQRLLWIVSDLLSSMALTIWEECCMDAKHIYKCLSHCLMTDSKDCITRNPIGCREYITDSTGTSSC